MNLTRRGFFKVVTAAGASTAIRTPSAHAASTIDLQNTFGCLVDTTLCVGCRKCEQACNERNHLPKPRESFDEMTVLENERRMDETTYTVVNKYYPKHIGALTWRTRPSFVKFQCMHCNDPACVSACIVGALTKQANGAVIYDASKCIGCRYCMVACPFQIPAYEYHNALTPQVRKCNFCFEEIEEGQPAGLRRGLPGGGRHLRQTRDLLRLANGR